MNLIVKFSEIERFILANSSNSIALSCIDEKTVQCTYTISIFGFNSEVYLNVEILSIEGSTLSIGISDTMVANFIIEQIKKQDDCNQCGIMVDDGNIKIDLSNIVGAGEVLEYVSLSNITVETEGVNIEVSVR